MMSNIRTFGKISLALFSIYILDVSYEMLSDNPPYKSKGTFVFLCLFSVFYLHKLLISFLIPDKFINKVFFLIDDSGYKKNTLVFYLLGYFLILLHCYQIFSQKILHSENFIILGLTCLLIGFVIQVKRFINIIMNE